MALRICTLLSIDNSFCNFFIAFYFSINCQLVLLISFVKASIEKENRMIAVLSTNGMFCGAGVGIPDVELRYKHLFSLLDDGTAEP